MKDVCVTSDSKQEFMGVAFYKCGPYFQRRGHKLHLVVYHTFNGPIPEGYEVHHIDENKDNNSINNLMLLPQTVHRKYHANGGTPALVPSGSPSKNEWWKTSSGKSYARNLKAKLTEEKKQTYSEAPCIVCGTLVHKNSKRLKHRTFCSSRCREEYYRKRSMRVMGCVVCGTEFHGYKTTKTCSEECRVSLISSSTVELLASNKTERVCSQCGSVYQGSLITNPSSVYLCSDACRAVYRLSNTRILEPLAPQYCIICNGLIANASREASFCSNKCYAKYRRDAKLDHVDRTCVICGSVFHINKYHKTKTCSVQCRGALLRETRKKVRH